MERQNSIFRTLEGIWKDSLYAARVLRKDLSFTAVAALALALGIGGNAAMFSIVNAVLLKPLPYPEPDQLVSLHEIVPKRGKLSVSWWDFQDWRRQALTLQSISAVQSTIFSLTGAGEPERLSGANVSAAFFPILGAQPFLGRTFGQDDDRKGAPRVVVLSYALWKRKFNGDRSLPGKSLTLNGRPAVVAGVLPPGFRFIEKVDVYAPIEPGASEMGGRRSHPNLNVIARVKPGAGLREVREEMNVISARLALQYPDSNTGESAVVQPLSQAYTGSLNRPLALLLGAVAFVLLIACANVANLLLARSAAREREMAVRSAIGASRRRILRQMLTESALLALTGSVLGLLLAYWGLRALVTLIPEDIRRLKDIHIDGQVLAFTMGVAVLTAFLFGIAPALQGSQANLQEGLKSGTRSVTGNPRRRWFRNGLVVCEVGLALVVLIGAGLSIRSLQRLQGLNLGFRPDHILTIPINLPPARYPTNERDLAFYNRLFEALQRYPGIASLGLSQCLPLKSGACWSAQFTPDGSAIARGEDAPSADFDVADSGYFRALRIPLLRGRIFDARDTLQSTPVILINETMARRYWPHEDAVGRRIQSGKKLDVYTVAGIVGDTRRRNLEGEIQPEIYMAASQSPGGMYLVLRTAVEPEALAQVVRKAIHEIDPDMPVHDVQSLESIVAHSLAARQLPMVLLTVFAVMALVLATVGIYGLLSYGVAQRTQELGIRMALGAKRTQVLRLVLGDGLRLALIGIGAGLLCAFGVTRLMASLLYGIGATDLPTYASLSLLLLAVSAAASVVPALRAARLDPLAALRRE